MNKSILNKWRERYEIWLPVPEYENLYEVSNLGNVKSLKRIIIRSDGQVRNFRERILKMKNNSEYNVVCLSKNGIRKPFLVHQLVAMAFLGHIPNRYKLVVDHVNKIKTDNRPVNLRMISHRKNLSRDRKGSSKYPGVSWLKCANRWRAQIQINGKRTYLGQYINELDAKGAYEDALVKFVL